VEKKKKKLFVGGVGKSSNSRDRGSEVQGLHVNLGQPRREGGEQSIY